MEENKDAIVSQVYNDYAEACQEAGMKNPSSVTVGTNGYYIGQEFNATGKIKVVKNIDEKTGKMTSCWVAVETVEGVDLSLKSLMNVSSLNGYKTEGAYENVSRAGKNVNTDEVKAEVIEDFDFKEMVTQPKTRNWEQFIKLADTEKLFAGKKITYLGQVVRPYTAKEDVTTSFDSYKKGDARAMVQKLWNY